MKKLFLFVMAMCFSVSIFAGGDIFEAWVTYAVNDGEIAAHKVGDNTNQAPVVTLGTINKFQLDSFFVKVWQDNGDHFDKVDVNYKIDNGTVQSVEGQWKQDLGGNDKEWGIKVNKDLVADLADGDHSLEVWFVGELNPGATAKDMKNKDASNYKFTFKKGTPEPKVTSWAIMGDFNGWTAGYNFAGADETALTTKVTVEANKKYEFKLIRIVAQGLVKDTTWFGLPSEGNIMKYGNCSDWKAYETKGENNKWNIGLQATKADDYTFTVNVTNKEEGNVLAPKFSVNIPEPAPDTREKRNIVLIPGDLKNDNPTMIIFAFTAGKEAYDATMQVVKEGEDTVAYKAEIPKELDSLIFVRAKDGIGGWSDLIWDGENKNVWNQSIDLKIEGDTARFTGDWGSGEGAKLVITFGAAPVPGGDTWYIKLPQAIDDWVWHEMDEEQDGTWSYEAAWFGGGANLNTAMEDKDAIYVEDAKMDFGENQVAPAEGTACKFIWNPTTQKLAVEYAQGIENIYELNVNAPMYNVLGAEVDATFKGVVIQNGHKFIR